MSVVPLLDGSDRINSSTIWSISAAIFPISLSISASEALTDGGGDVTATVVNAELATTGATPVWIWSIVISGAIQYDCTWGVSELTDGVGTLRRIAREVGLGWEGGDIGIISEISARSSVIFAISRSTSSFLERVFGDEVWIFVDGTSRDFSEITGVWEMSGIGSSGFLVGSIWGARGGKNTCQNQNTIKKEAHTAETRENICGREKCQSIGDFCIVDPVRSLDRSSDWKVLLIDTFGWFFDISSISFSIFSAEIPSLSRELSPSGMLFLSEKNIGSEEGEKRKILNIGRDFFESSRNNLFCIGERFSAYLRNFFITHLVPDTHRQDHAIPFFEVAHVTENWFDSLTSIDHIVGMLRIGWFPCQVIPSFERTLISQMIYQSRVGDMQHPWEELSIRITTKLPDIFQSFRVDIRYNILSESCIQCSMKQKSVHPIIGCIIEISESR